MRGRLQLAESGQWHELRRGYFADVATADRVDRSRYDRSAGRALPMQPLTDAEVFISRRPRRKRRAMR